MINNETKCASNKMSDAFEKLNLLKRNQKYYSVRECLELASVIRDNVIRDANIIQSCKEDLALSKERQHIFALIKEFQDDLLDAVESTIKTDDEIKYNEPFDYVSAKNNLAELAKNEIAEEVKWAGEKPEEVSIIESYEAHLESLHNIVDRCENDKYTILLMGEYQSGKTTTLNALCEGMQLGAIGKGAKTSAVPLTVSYSEKKDISIQWKTKNDFYDIFHHLKGYCPDIDFDNLDIDDSVIRLNLLNKIDVLRMRINNVDVKDHQFIILSCIILRYWKSSELKEIMRRKIMFDEIEALGKFPKKMMERWTNKGISDFSALESAFVFIKQIDCHIDSTILKTLNCIITDCPGLFANEYDTQVTENAMKDADAILYILPREKQSGNQIDESLEKLRNNYSDYVHRKLVVANNLISNHPNTSTIYEANQSNIKRALGSDFNVIPYDARAAYLDKIKMAYDNKRLDDFSIKNFIISNPSKRFDFRIGKTEETVFDSFDDTWKNCVREYSYEQLKNNGLDQLLDFLVAFIERNKAVSIIIDKGIRQLNDELKTIQNNLKIHRIEPYRNNRDEMEEQWEKRMNSIKQFGNEASDIVHHCLFDSQSGILDKLSVAVYSKLFPTSVYDTMADKICDKIYSEAATLKKLESDKDKFSKYTEKIVSECITKVLQDRVSYWNNLMSSNQDVDFNNIFVSAVDLIELKVTNKWNSLFVSDDAFKNDMKSYYPIYKDTKKFSINSKNQNANMIIEQKDISAVISLNNAAVAVGAAGAIACGAAIALALSGPIGWLVAGLVALGGGLWGQSSIEERNRNKFKKKAKPIVEKQLNNGNIKESIKGMIKAEVKRLLNTYEELLRVDMGLVQRKRDLALASLDDPKKEENCFIAVGSITKLDTQKKLYNDFLSSL